jgi:hypothetical protein
MTKRSKTRNAASTPLIETQVRRTSDADADLNRKAIRITVVGALIGVVPVTFPEKFVSAIVALLTGTIFIWWASTEVARARKLILAFGVFLLIEGFGFGLYRHLSRQTSAEVTPSPVAPQTAFNDEATANAAVLRVANYSSDPNCVSCWKHTVAAQPGDIVAFNILVGVSEKGVVAHNVKAAFETQQLGTGLLGKAMLSADNASQVAASAEVRVSDQYRDVRFSSLWAGPAGYRLNKGVWEESEAPGAPPLFYLGDLRYGSDHDRRIVVKYRVEGTPPPAPSQTGCLALWGETRGTGSVTPTSAQLIGTGASDRTKTWFDFGPNPQMVWSVSDSGGIGSVNGLLPLTTYYFRYVAQNACGLSVVGETKSFTTPAH